MKRLLLLLALVGFFAVGCSKKYAVGDLIDINGVKGVVFYVDESVVKVVSVESAGLKWSTEFEITGADDMCDGLKNQKTIQSRSGWESKYPAFKWCADLGEGWYLPAIEELQVIYDAQNTINSALYAEDYPMLMSNDYLSSTECYDDDEYSAYAQSCGAWINWSKYVISTVRAVYVLKI